ncbi:hypothetical protein BSR29_07735 [Boudabousia liubingyangii]|uniref:YobI-like P-loop NTPase domain-containing protein n=1 Tax=Boudabousia liubingyangii TaxID=1921764 RepID=A0A1Q5PJS2_9ACTO|nr:hypothetical protein [Boudabousia liubingyangii]OKL46138.1 hypothetical protein BSR29_07735 [Boudabousia liubingyangii]
MKNNCNDLDRKFRYLGPQYIEEFHKPYLDVLEGVLKNGEVRNIALLGDYSSGKSSIIDGLIEKNTQKVLRINIYAEPSEQRNAGYGRELETSNQLQRAILNALFMSASPSNLATSKIATVRATKRYQAIFVLLTFLVASFILIKETRELIKTAVYHVSSYSFGFPILALSFLTISVLLVAMYSYLFTRLTLSGVGLAGIRFDLDDGKGIFENYVDEISNLLTREKIEIIVFEDLERFNNRLIFEELRNLNALLNLNRGTENTCLGVRKSNKSFRFIYVVDGALFRESFDSSRQQNERNEYPVEIFIKKAELTSKFFDFIISIPPLTTINESFEDIKNVLVNQDEISGRLVASIQELGLDYRVLKNIRNQYLILKTSGYSENLIEKSKLRGIVSDDGPITQNDANLALAFFLVMFPDEIYRLKTGASMLNEVARVLVERTNDYRAFLKTYHVALTTLKSQLLNIIDYLEKNDVESEDIILKNEIDTSNAENIERAFRIMRVLRDTTEEQLVINSSSLMPSIWNISLNTSRDEISNRLLEAVYTFNPRFSFEEKELQKVVVGVKYEPTQKTGEWDENHVFRGTLFPKDYSFFIAASTNKSRFLEMIRELSDRVEHIIDVFGKAKIKLDDDRTSGIYESLKYFTRNRSSSESYGGFESPIVEENDHWMQSDLTDLRQPLLQAFAGTEAQFRFIERWLGADILRAYLIDEQGETSKTL